MQASAEQAVSLADRNADPSSRFVAVGSSQETSKSNPVLLFLLSSRLPYTKWYTYDPELQTSVRIQTDMVRELELSASHTAVVWRTREDKGMRTGVPGRFGSAVDRLYPTTIARFGDYEVRSR